MLGVAGSSTPKHPAAWLCPRASFLTPGLPATPLLRSFDAVGGVSAEANNESVAALAGIDPADLLMAEWCVCVSLLLAWLCSRVKRKQACALQAPAGSILGAALLSIGMRRYPPSHGLPATDRRPGTPLHVQAQQPVPPLPLCCAGQGQPVRRAVHQV